MRPLLASASLAAAIAVLALPSLPQSARAGTSVLRCEMPDGSRVYSNKACASFGATSAPMEADVLNRIKSDHRRQVRLQAERDGQDVASALAELDADRMVASVASVRRPVVRRAT